MNKNYMIIRSVVSLITGFATAGVMWKPVKRFVGLEPEAVQVNFDFDDIPDEELENE